MQKKYVYNPKHPLNVASLNWAIPENIHVIQDIWMGGGRMTMEFQGHGRITHLKCRNCPIGVVLIFCGIAQGFYKC